MRSQIRPVSRGPGNMRLFVGALQPDVKPHLDWCIPRLRALSQFALVVSLCALAACSFDRGRNDKPGHELWLPAGAESHAGTQCYRDGSCDLSFRSPDLDPVELTDQLTRHFRDAGWEQRCPVPPIK